MLYSTAYHPQTNGQSERTNQTIEIALRYYLATMENESKWPRVLPHIQYAFNSSVNSSGYSPYQLVMGFTPNGLNPSAELPEINIRLARIEVADALNLAAIKSKVAYDRKHMPIFFRAGN